jgi:hypothetical protein
MTPLTLSIITVLAGALSLGMAIYTAINLRKLQQLRQNFISDNQPENLEEILSAMAFKLKAAEKRHAATESYVEELEQRLMRAIQKVGMIRFNAYGDEGGNLSFSTALLDHNNTGVLITSLHGRDQNRVYTKPIIGGACEISLSEEEREAVIAAINANRISI